MKNILVIATYFPPMAGIGTVRVTKYVKYLRKFGWNPIVVTLDSDELKGNSYDDTLLKDIENIEVIRLKCEINNKNLGKNFLYTLKKEISSIIERHVINAFFITGGPFEPLEIASFIYRKYKIPYVIDLRDPWKLQNINTNNKIIRLKCVIQKFIIGFKEKKIFKNAYKICTVNDTMTNNYAKEYPKFNEKFISIPNGYDIDDYKSIVPKNFEKFTIVYAGKFSVSAGFRNPTNVFNAIKKLNDEGKEIQFIHVGEVEDKIVKIANEIGIKEYCKFIGRKTYMETLEYSKGASLLLVIGGKEKSEQTGKIFDCIGCNVPTLVLANADSEINVVCKEFPKAICIEKNDINNIVESIEKIYLGKKIFKDNKISNIYTRENLTKKLAGILDSIYGEKEYEN